VEGQLRSNCRGGERNRLPRKLRLLVMANLSLLIAIITTFIFFLEGITTIIELVFFFACVFAIASQLQTFIIKIIRTKKIKLNYFASFLSHIGVSLFLVGAVLYGAFRVDEIVFLEKNKLFETKNGFQCIIVKVYVENDRKYSYIVPCIGVKYEKNNFYLKPKLTFTRIIDKSIVLNNSYYEIEKNNEIENHNNTYQKSFDSYMFPDIVSIGLTDIYIEPINSPVKDGFLFLISVKPYIKLVWIGFATLFCGLLISLIPHRND